jgi:hypothetical protein
LDSVKTLAIRHSCGLGYFKLRIKFIRGAYRNVKELHKFLRSLPRRTLGNIAGDRDCAAPHLADYADKSGDW